MTCRRAAPIYWLNLGVGWCKRGWLVSVCWQKRWHSSLIQVAGTYLLCLINWALQRPPLMKDILVLANMSLWRSFFMYYNTHHDLNKQPASRLTMSAPILRSTNEFNQWIQTGLLCRKPKEPIQWLVGVELIIVKVQIFFRGFLSSPDMKVYQHQNHLLTKL